jgi:hypothetical protein
MGQIIAAFERDLKSYAGHCAADGLDNALAT